MEEEMMKKSKINLPEKPVTPLYFETHTQSGYENLVQFLRDIFNFSKQLRRMPLPEAENKFNALQQMLEHTPKSVVQYPMNCFLELKLTLTERVILAVLIRCKLMSPVRTVELENILMSVHEEVLSLDELFSFFVLKKGTLRQSPFIMEHRLGGCTLKKEIGPSKRALQPKKTVRRHISPQSIRAQLDKFVVGQDEAKEKLSVAFFEHILKCDLSSKERSFYKNNVFLIGPTGTGKTYLCRTLAEQMKVPFLHADMSQYTASGYVGNSVKDIITNLAEMVPCEENKLPLSIVFLDEIDKITSKNMSNNGRDIRGTSVQEELLRMLETRTIRAERTGGFRNEARTYDICNVFFVAAGACSGLDKIIKARQRKKQGVGFVPPQGKDPQEGVQAQDLLEYGFLPEFLSRFSYVAQLSALTEEQLTDVLLHTENNTLSQYKALFAACKKPLRFSAAQAKKLAHQACGHELGVRALNQLLSEEMTRRLRTLDYEHTTQEQADEDFSA